jgi:hypothetical protein
LIPNAAMQAVKSIGTKPTAPGIVDVTARGSPATAKYDLAWH